MQAVNFLFMKIFQQESALKDHLKKVNAGDIGLVPTMGALHAGHISLVEKSLNENQITVVSIFVNPTQFDNPEDLQNYPKTFEQDIKKLEALNGKIVVFSPNASEIYGKEIKASHFDFDGLEHQMEGKYRTGHFDGVGTIVRRFFEIVMPDNAYFGEKDYQQFLIVKTMAAKEKIPVNVVGCPIKREENGLAMSSRNERLSNELRNKAGIIYKMLKTAKQKFGTESAYSIKEWVKKQFDAVEDFSLEYIEIADAETLKTLKRKVENKKYRAFIAVYVEGIRLIDNIALN